MKTIAKILLLSLFISCGGKGGDASLHVIVWDKYGDQVWDGELEITYRTKKTKPKKHHDTFYIIEGSADLDNLKLGNYTVTYQGSPTVDACATQFKISYEAEVVIVLREGEFIVHPH